MSPILFVIFLVHYTLSELHGTQQRFSIENARRRIEPVNVMPTEIAQYTVGRNGTGIYSEWYKDEIELETISRLLTEGVRFILTNPGLQTRNISLTLTVVEDFISRVKARFETEPKPLRGYPWGRNWFGFSVDLTTMLGYYLLLPAKLAVSGDAEQLIKMIITNPTSSLGMHLWGSNSVYMAGSWILVKLLEGEAEQAANTTEYRGMLEYNEMKIKMRRDEEGLHRDHTFIFHGCGVFFRYFQSLITNDSVRLLYAIDSDARPPIRQWEEVSRILFHPTITYGNIGLLGRVQQLSYETNPNSEYGIKVMPFCGYLRYFTKSGQFSMRAQKAHLAFYEPDATVKNLGQYWVQYRCVHRERTDYSIEFPAPGLIAHQGDTNLIYIPSSDFKGCAKTFRPKMARSFVMAYENVGFLYQEYEIVHFGQYSVREFITVNSNAENVLITIEITNNESEKNLVYYSPLYWDWDNGPEQSNNTVTIKPRETKLIGTLMSMNDKRGNAHIEDPLPITFPMSVGNLKIEEYAAAKCFVLFHQASPVVCAPYDWDSEEEAMKVQLNSNNLNYTTFTFNSLANQYVYSDSICLCVEPLAVFLQGALIFVMQRVFTSLLE